MASLDKKEPPLLLLSKIVAELDSCKALNPDKIEYAEGKLWFDLNNTRLSNGEYVNIYASLMYLPNESDVPTNLNSVWIDTDEFVRGNIKPYNKEGELEEQLVFPHSKPKEGEPPRGLRGEYKPSMQIPKYYGDIKIVNGEVIYPPESAKSVLFQLFVHIDNVYEYSIRAAVRRGENFKYKITNGEEVDMDNFNKKCIFLSTKMKDDIIDSAHPKYKPNELQKMINDHALVVKNTNIANIIQRKTAKGEIMHNPLMRINIPIDEITGELKNCVILNKAKKHKVKLPTGEIKEKLQPLMYKGKLMNKYNIHMGIRSGSNIKGTMIKPNALCCSSLGISFPIGSTLIYVKPYVPKPKIDTELAQRIGLVSLDDAVDDTNDDQMASQDENFPDNVSNFGFDPVNGYDE
jgi:hypothetical protein